MTHICCRSSLIYHVSVRLRRRLLNNRLCKFYFLISWKLIIDLFWLDKNLITPPTSLRKLLSITMISHPVISWTKIGQKFDYASDIPGQESTGEFWRAASGEVDSPFATSSSLSSGRFEALSRLRRSIFIIPKIILLFIIYNIIIFIIYYFICLLIKTKIWKKKLCSGKNLRVDL